MYADRGGASTSGPPFDHYEAKPGTMFSKADEIMGKGKKVDGVSDRVVTAHRPAAAATHGVVLPQIQGAPKPVQQKAQKVNQTTTFAGGCVKYWGLGIQTFNKGVDKLNDEWNAAVKDDFGLTKPTKPGTSGTPMAGNVRVLENYNADLAAFNTQLDTKRAAKAKELRSRFSKLETKLDNKAEKVSGMLKKGPDDKKTVRALFGAGVLPLSAVLIYPKSYGLSKIKFKTLPQELQGKSDSETAQYLLGLIGAGAIFDTSLVPLLPPGAKQQVARDAAGDVKTKAVDAATVRVLQLFRKDQPFASSFYRSVTPDQMADAIKSLSDQAYTLDGNAPRPRGTVDHDDVALYSDFLAASGQTLATYSKATGEYAPPSDLGQTWGREITDEDNPENAAALSLLLREGGRTSEYDATFLSDVADEVYEYERDHEGESPWSSRAEDVTVYDPIADPDDPSKLQLHYVKGADALANVLGAMHHSPEAAQKFFLDGYPDGDTSAENERLKYLIEERTWSAASDSDEGDGLGKALEAATIGDRDHERLDGTGPYQDELSARIASEALTNIAEKSGDGDKLGKLDDEWHLHKEMADSVGKIVAGYMDDVYDIVDNNSQRDAASLQISKEDLGIVVGEVGRSDDKTGLQVITTAAVIEGNERLSDVIEEYKREHPGQELTLEKLATSDLKDLLDGQGDRNGTVVRYLLDTGLKGGEEKEIEEAERQQLLASAVGVGTKFIPSPNGAIAAGLTSAGIEVLTKQIGAAPAPTTLEVGDELGDDIDKNLEYGTISALMDNGYLEPTADDPATKQNEEAGVPRSLTIEQDGHRILRPDLIDSNGVEKLDPDLSPTEAAQIRKDWATWQDSNDRRYAQAIAAASRNGFDRGAN